MIRCDECREMFPSNPRERKRTDGGVDVYLSCPHCAREYPSARISAKGVMLRRQIDKMRASGRGNAQNRPFTRLLKQFKREVTRPDQEDDDGHD